MMKIRQSIVYLFVLFLLTTTLQAQDPVTVAPDLYKKLFENDRVRVMEVKVAPGAKIATHSHPGHVAYSVGPCTLTITTSGKTEESTMKDGEALWFDATTHSAENSGSTSCRIVVVELKEKAPAK